MLIPDKPQCVQIFSSLPMSHRVNGHKHMRPVVQSLAAHGVCQSQHARRSELMKPTECQACLAMLISASIFSQQQGYVGENANVGI